MDISQQLLARDAAAAGISCARMRLAIALLIMCTATAAAQPVQTFASDPHPGIHRETWKDTSVPVTIRVIRVDLSSAEIDVLATKPHDAGQTTSAYEVQQSAQVALNGDMFSVAGYQPEGLAMGEAMVWPNTADDTTSAVLHFGRTGAFTTAGIEIAQHVDTVATLPASTQGIVSGRPLLVESGNAITQYDCQDPVTIPCDQAPRSAVALTEDGNTMILVAVDGWNGTSYGLSDADLATFLASPSVGAYTALALDSGGASTLVVDDSVISTPSDGVERVVANHIAVKYGMLPAGELLGLICDTSLNPCVNSGANVIAGATVTLDDGSTQTTSSTGLYDFHGVTPRLVCVTARKSGYYPGSRCVYVPSNGQEYGSIALQPCPTGGCIAMPDAGVPDAAPLGIDAPTGIDAGHDAGNAQMGPGESGCCDAGGDRPPILLGGVVAIFLTRRRGKTASTT